MLQLLSSAAVRVVVGVTVDPSSPQLVAAELLRLQPAHTGQASCVESTGFTEAKAHGL